MMLHRCGITPLRRSSNAFRLYSKYQVQKKIRIPHDSVYAVVSDVTKYHEFVPYCAKSELKTPNLAELTVQWRNLEEKFESQLEFTPTEVHAWAINSHMFENLKCEWSVKPVNASSCEVTLNLIFKFQNPVYNLITKTAMRAVSKAMLTAFLTRAQQLYLLEQNKRK